MPFLIAFGLALVLTPLAARIAPVFGLVDRPDPVAPGPVGAPLKLHARPVPVLGGAALAAAALFAPSVLGRGPGLSLVAAVGVALGAGVADDVRPLPPWVRVQLQIIAGTLLAAGGFRFGPEGAVGVVGVLLLVLACANAVNLVDGQDGLAGGLGAIAAMALALMAQGDARAVGLAVAGALSAFLLWNRPPARIFLGNGGAYALGVLLAALVAAVATADGVRGVLGAGLCLAVFAFELLSTVARRIASGASLAEGDRRHVYDLLAARLGSRTRSTVVFWITGALCAGTALLIAP
jgi:UDP-GlcNAc:undecaprenyl-phosphate GlcNAc-1-phosphate transferase